MRCLLSTSTHDETVYVPSWMTNSPGENLSPIQIQEQSNCPDKTFSYERDFDCRGKTKLQALFRDINLLQELKKSPQTTRSENKTICLYLCHRCKSL